MSSSIGWGVIGCGDVIERKVVDAFGKLPDAQLVAVMRRTPGLARDFARRHGVPVWTTDAQEVINHEDVDVVYIATPPQHHLEYALAVCAAGRACVVEKPAGRSEQECRKLLQAFKAASLPLYVSYYRRYLPRFLKVRELIHTGEIGSVIAIDYRMRKLPAKAGWRLSPEINGGGRFYDLSGHMFNLFDHWFGPLTYQGGGAMNAIPAHTAEDVVTVAFRTTSGALGSASWNFAATHNEDELVIEGMLGRIVMQGTSVSAKVKVERNARTAIRVSHSLRRRSLRQVKEFLKLPFQEIWRFERKQSTHLPFLAHVNQDLRQRRTGQTSAAEAPWTEHAEAALRTAGMMNQALNGYYRGRTDKFWDRPDTWHNLRTAAAARTAEDQNRAYLLSDEQIAFFEQQGYLGPFRCDDNWREIAMPVKKGRNLHLIEPRVFQLCTHPSIVRPVAQLIGSADIALFKSRFVVKSPSSPTDVAWHQDVGDSNGGYLPNGDPVPTVSVWMALDKVTLENGAMEVLPGSHRRLIGNYQKKIRAELLETGALSKEDLKRAVPLELEPGEFYIFHSWLLHGSNANTSAFRRGGINMRYVQKGYECEATAVYFPLKCNDPMRTRLLAIDNQPGDSTAA